MNRVQQARSQLRQSLRRSNGAPRGARRNSTSLCFFECGAPLQFFLKGNQQQQADRNTNAAVRHIECRPRIKRRETEIKQKVESERLLATRTHFFQKLIKKLREKIAAGNAAVAEYHQQLAACACKLGEKQNDHIMWDKCIRHLAHSIYADPRNVVAWATAATNYMALGHEQLAIRASDAAARLSPTPDALAALGINYARVGRYGHAIRCFREALEANPNLHRTRVELLHKSWTKDRTYLPPATTGKPAALDPAVLVTPPKGMEVGFVPIVVRQEITAP